MKLTPKQVEWINEEKKFYQEMIRDKKKHSVDGGILGDQIHLSILDVIITLHNIELEDKNVQGKD